MISFVLFLSATAVRCVEVKKEPRSNLIYIFYKAAAEAFCILVLRVYIPYGAAQCLFTVFFFALLLLLLCLFVNFFPTSEQGFFLVQEIFLDQMAWAVSRIKWNYFGFQFLENCPSEF